MSRTSPATATPVCCSPPHSALSTHPKVPRLLEQLCPLQGVRGQRAFPVTPGQRRAWGLCELTQGRANADGNRFAVGSQVMDTPFGLGCVSCCILRRYYQMVVGEAGALSKVGCETTSNQHSKNTPSKHPVKHHVWPLHNHNPLTSLSPTAAPSHRCALSHHSPQWQPMALT